ncbi:MAG: hypothetical protein JO248_05710 [Acidimicrobiia bacterium]|nr:hypothetical protein [Acidimicrobiia bacterium]
MAAPLQNMAGLLQALPQNFAYALRALADQQGGVVDVEAPAEVESPAPDATAEPPDTEGEATEESQPIAESPAPDATAEEGEEQ